jgi:hypothetical protein
MPATKENLKSRAADPRTEQTAGEASSVEEPGATEAQSEEMVLTYSPETGEVIRIEKVDRSGGRQELSGEEYAQFFGQSPEAADETSLSDPNAYDSAEAFAIAHQQLGFEQGYYYGLAEYEAALAAQAQPAYSPEEEAAYYQGVADYHALVSGLG